MYSSEIEPILLAGITFVALTARFV